MRCYRSLPLRLDRRKRGSSIEESRVRESVSGHRCPAFFVGFAISLDRSCVSRLKVMLEDISAASKDGVLKSQFSLGKEVWWWKRQHDIR